MKRAISMAVAILTGAAAYPAIPARAALPPIYDRLNQFFAALNVEGLARSLSPGMIDRVEMLEYGSFRVWSGECYVDVTVSAVEPPGPPVAGGTTYEGHLGEKACR